MDNYTCSGALGQDPKFFPNDDPKKICVKFSVGVKKYSKNPDEPQVKWVSCTAFGSTATYINTYGKKGTKILISGQPEVGMYTRKDSTEQVAEFKVTVQNAELFNTTGATATTEASHTQSAMDSVDIPF